MMKILIATGIYPPESGGPATYVKLLEERLPALGFAVTVLPFRTVRHLPKLIRHVAYFWKCFLMARQADVVYAQDIVSVGLPAALASLLAGKKFLVRVPGDYAWEQARQRFGVTDELEEFQTKRYGWRTELLRSIQKFVVHRARKVVVPSEFMKKVVCKWTHPEKIHVIYSSIEMPIPASVDRPEGFLVVSSGRRVPWKHFDAIERVVKREPGWRFFLATDLPRQEALGWVKTADAFVLNSTYEGLSHALVEAMMLGTPVVATRVGGNPELIADGITGLLIPPKDDEALLAALKNIEQERDAALVRVETAKKHAQEFSIDKTIGQLVVLLKTV